MSGQLLYRIGELVADLHFLGIEYRAGLGQSQLEILDLGIRRSHTQRHGEFDAEIPAGVIRMRESPITAGQRGTAVGKQVVTERVDPVAADHIQPRSNQAASRLELQFHAANRPALPSQFDPLRQGLDQVRLPVGFETSRHQFIRRPQDRPIAGRQPEHSPQDRFGTVEFAESRLGLGPCLKKSIPGEGFIRVGETLLSPTVEDDLGIPPGFLGTVASRHSGIPLAVGQVKFPVEILDVLDQVDRRLFELGQCQVIIDPRNQDALADPTETTKLLCNRAGNPSELGSRTCQQRLPVADVDVAGVGRGVQVE